VAHSDRINRNTPRATVARPARSPLAASDGIEILGMSSCGWGCTNWVFTNLHDGPTATSFVSFVIRPLVDTPNGRITNQQRCEDDPPTRDYAWFSWPLAKPN
jgi:hypothetical protein